METCIAGLMWVMGVNSGLCENANMHPLIYLFFVVPLLSAALGVWLLLSEARIVGWVILISGIGAALSFGMVLQSEGWAFFPVILFPVFGAVGSGALFFAGFFRASSGLEKTATYLLSLATAGMTVLFIMELLWL